jgi:hypothetical protein
MMNRKAKVGKNLRPNVSARTEKNREIYARRSDYFKLGLPE